MMTIQLKRAPGRTAQQGRIHPPSRRRIRTWELHLFLVALLVLGFSLFFLNDTLPERAVPAAAQHPDG